MKAYLSYRIVTTLFCLSLAAGVLAQKETHTLYAEGLLSGAYQFKYPQRGILTVNEGLMMTGFAPGLRMEKGKFEHSLLLQDMRRYQGSAQLYTYEPFLRLYMSEYKSFSYGFAYQFSWNLYSGKKEKFRFNAGAGSGFNHFNLRTMDNSEEYRFRSNTFGINPYFLAVFSYSPNPLWAIRLELPYSPVGYTYNTGSRLVGSNWEPLGGAWSVNDRQYTRLNARIGVSVKLKSCE